MPTTGEPDTLGSPVTGGGVGVAVGVDVAVGVAVGVDVLTGRAIAVGDATHVRATPAALVAVTCTVANFPTSADVHIIEIVVELVVTQSVVFGGPAELTTVGHAYQA